MVSDHVVIPTRTSAPYPYSRSGQFPGGAHQDYQEPLALMAWLLGQTKHVRVGVTVLVIPYRNPVVTAKQIATMDVLSGGRVIVGAGVGWWPEEFEALAAPPFAERGAVTDEYLRLMKVLWTEEDPRFTGKYYRIGDVIVAPKPVQKPHPPIWIGGHTPRAIRRAAELGDAWHPIGLRETISLGPDELAASVQELRDAARGAGRDPSAVRVALRVPLDLWSARRSGRSAGADRSPRPLAGPPTKVAADLRAYERAGVDTFVFDLPPTDLESMLDTMTRFATEVRPKVARASRAS
jgi:probable F420-dependent oxidoreductase